MNNSIIPINDYCYGCGVCVVACPTKAISMKSSEEGFWIPSANESKCIQCGICNQVCSYIDSNITTLNKIKQPRGYAIINNDDSILKQSTSGGAGYAIAKYLFLKGYNLVGVKYDKHTNTARHFVATSLEDFKQTMNSKYIPSYTVDGFATLLDGKKYAVFGTPCQIDSLRRWLKLKKQENNVILIDLFCHGVPSYLYWNAYVKHYLSDNEILETPIFRDKQNGWHRYTMTLKTDRRQISNTLQGNDLFQNNFFGNYILNIPCYTCKFRGQNSAADIRMGDLWGGKYSHNESGVTGILSFTKSGDEIIENLNDSCNIQEEEIMTICAGQILNDIQIPKQRKYIFDSIRNNKPLNSIYLKYNYKMWLKNLVPFKVKSFIKHIIYTLQK